MIEHRPLKDVDEKREVELLVARCDLKEELSLPVYVPDVECLPEGGIPPWLWTEDGNVLGFLAVEGWPIPEGTPIVHPDHRLRGIGRALVEAATDTCRSRGLKRWLMVGDAVSAGAPLFAERVGARYENAEYRMKLDPELLPEETAGSARLRIEKIQSADTDRFAEVQAAAFGDPIDQVRKWAAEQSHLPNVRLFIVLSNSEPVGCVRLITIGFEAYITALGVLPAHRRQGIGRWIVLNRVRQLMAEGWEKIFIEVDTSNESAYRLYRKCGFRETRTYPFFELLTGN